MPPAERADDAEHDDVTQRRAEPCKQPSLLVRSRLPPPRPADSGQGGCQPTIRHARIVPAKGDLRRWQRSLGWPSRVRSVLPIGAGVLPWKISVRSGAERHPKDASAASALDGDLGAAAECPARGGRTPGGWSPWVAGRRSVGLEPADLVVGGARDGGDQLAVLVDDAQGRVAELDGHGFPGVAEADLDALAGDLDPAAAGDPPLDGQAWLWQRAGPGQADALQPVALAGRDRAGCATARRLGPGRA